MDPSVLNPWVVLVVGILGLGSTIWNLVSKPGAKAQADVAELSRKVEDFNRTLTGKVDAVEERIAVIESEMGHLPNREMVHAMELAFRDLKGEVAVLVARVGPIAQTSERLQQFLLEQARSRDV